jgi:mono/diheme cytochrome c family protein
MKAWSTTILLALALAGSASAGNAAPEASTKAVRHGEYLIRVAGCNDCHTPGYALNGGTAPQYRLLTGEGFVFSGPWGTTYPINLRLFAQDLSAQQWIKTLRTTKARPPMPWYSFESMSDYDLTSMYYYIRSLGPAGKPAHAYLPPGQAPAPPYMEMVLPPVPTTGASGGR